MLFERAEYGEDKNSGRGAKETDVVGGGRWRRDPIKRLCRQVTLHPLSHHRSQHQQLRRARLQKRQTTGQAAKAGDPKVAEVEGPTVRNALARISTFSLLRRYAFSFSESALLPALFLTISHCHLD